MSDNRQIDCRVSVRTSGGQKSEKAHCTSHPGLFEQEERRNSCAITPCSIYKLEGVFEQNIPLAGGIEKIPSRLSVVTEIGEYSGNRIQSVGPFFLGTAGV
ncbi:Uncharacterised protein [Rhodococcus rhodochrous]|nr:Uncharacterised protein [Rhodococcus rhodochrous]